MLGTYVILTLSSSVIKPCKWDQAINYVWKLHTGLRDKSRVRIKSVSYVRLTLGSYVIKPCKWNQKVASNYVWKLH